MGSNTLELNGGAPPRLSTSTEYESHNNITDNEAALLEAQRRRRRSLAYIAAGTARRSAQNSLASDNSNGNSNNVNPNNRHGHGTAMSRTPVDPWCDDGSLSRVEPPWLRDKRLKRQQPQQQQQERPNSQSPQIALHNHGSTNPFDRVPSTSPGAATNPFDTSSHYSDSSSSYHRGQSPSASPSLLLPSSSRTNSRQQENLPNDAFATTRPLHMNTNSAKGSTNPFDSSMEGSTERFAPDPPTTKSRTNPFDTSTDSSMERQLKRATSPSQVQPIIIRPGLPQYVPSSKDSVEDSLDKFLDTTDATVVSSEVGDFSSRRQTPEKSLASKESSDGSALSKAAQEAVEELRRSFNRPPKSPHQSVARSMENNDHPPNVLETPPHLYSMTHKVTPSPGSSARKRSDKNFAPSPVTPGATARTPTLATMNESPSTRQATESLVPATPNSEPVTPLPSSPTMEAPIDDEMLFALHDLCDEARSTDDIAWRNALHLLSVQPHLASQVEPECQMTPLHVCCLALDAPPLWIIRALLYTNPEQCQQEDGGGRLPLHLVAATSAHLETMQLLVEDYPASVAHRDARGFTPLQLLLKNDQISLTLEHVRIALGQTHSKHDGDVEERNGAATYRKRKRPLFRKGEHLQQSFQDLQALREEQQEKHEQVFLEYPDDVQRCLRKITQWKRRQINKGIISENNTGQLALVYENPASLATPTAQLLPLHLLVRRLPQQRTGGIPAPPTKEILARVLIGAYPLALTTMDRHGRTPLMTALLQSEWLPSLELLEMLLGKLTPELAQESSRSPAKIAAADTLQLPLHIAAEEFADNLDVISTLVEAFPAAIQVQDARGRTPLLCALSNYRSVPIDENIFGLLYQPAVAKISNDDGVRPLDWIVDHPDSSLLQPRGETVVGTYISGDNDVYNSLILANFLQASIDPPKNLREAEDLMETVRALPPWLRRLACSSTVVQRVLLREMATPMNTALMFLQGVALIGLLVVLRMALEGVTDTWVLVQYFSSYLLALQVVSFGTAWYLGEFYRLILSNGWRWIDLFASCCALGVASVVRNDISLDESILASTNLVPSDRNDVIATLGAWATGLAWASLVGFSVQWWCGMAVFVGSAFQLLSTLFWPFVLGGAGIIAMAQVLYTLEDCTVGNICGLGDAYTTVYWMILGEPILGMEVSVLEQQATTSMLVVLICFTLLWLWWLVSIVVMTVSEAQQLDRQFIALRWFWEPKVALTISSRSSKETIYESSSWVERYCNSMETLWHVLASSIKGGYDAGKRDIHWYAWCFRPGIVFLTRIVACLVLPIWFLLGVATLGILWPPQIRRWLFSTKIDSRKDSEDRLSVSKLSRIKGDIQGYQQETLQQNHAIQEDLAQIKEILFRAMELDETPVKAQP